MRKQYNFAAVLAAVLLVCCGALILGQKVNAAGEGKITGTVKLDGAAPHMKGIDMSKDPYCVQGPRERYPATWKPFVVGASGGLENVVLYISDWTGAAPRHRPRSRYSIKRTACTRRTCWRWT